jgi:SAM-dependent methyltransferase
MQYDKIKKSLGNTFNSHPLLRIIFYKLLDILLLRSWHIRNEIRRFKRESLQEANILDAGSGFGQYSYFLAKLSGKFSITAVDVKEEQVTDCNAFFGKAGLAGRVKFQIADLTTYTAENSYNLIISIDVMEHIEDDISVFRNFYKNLKSGGWLLISTPSDKGGSDVHDNGESSFIEEHVRDGYNIDDICKKLHNAGFEKIEARYSYGVPGQISWRLSMKYPMLMLGSSKLFFILLPFYYLITFPFCIILNYLDLFLKHASGTGLIVKALRA